MADVLQRLLALVRAAHPRHDYQALYFGAVIAQSDDLLTVDVQPNDPKLPSMSGVELRGEPGVTTDLRDPVTKQVPKGISVLAGWENGDPALPFACLFRGADSVPKKTIAADSLFLGGEDGAEPAPKGNALMAYLATVASAAGAPPPDPATLLSMNVLVK